MTKGTRAALLLLLPLAACTVAGLGPAQSPFRQSSLDFNKGLPHRAVVASDELQRVVDRIIELAKPRDMVLVRQSDCSPGRCNLAFRGKPVDRRIFRGTESLTLSYYSRYFISLEKRGGRAVRVSAVGVPVLGGEMACPRQLERSSGCRLPRLDHPRDEDLVGAVRKEWGYDVSGANEAEMLQGLLAELTRVAPTAAPRHAPRKPRAEPSTATPADREAYARLRLEGKACYRQRDYRCALDRFRQAQARVPTPAMRFNIASAQDKLGLAVLAAREYSAYLRQASAVPAAVRRHITGRMAELTRRIGRIRLVVRPPAATVSLNGTPQGSPPRPGTWELIVEPGTHQLDLACPGLRPTSLTVTLLPGETKEAAVTLQR